MRAHHQESIQNLIRVLEQDSRFLAVILSGSIAKGTEKEFSDIDVYLVVTDEDFLEENHIMFPCHKDLMARTDRAESKPEGYKEMALDLLNVPDDEKMERFFRAFCDWAGPRMPFAKALSLFVCDSEWNWMDGNPPLSDC